MHQLQIMAEPDWTLGWGLGIELWRRGERIFGGHTGGFPGFLSILVYSRPDRVGAVVLANSGRWEKLSATGLALVGGRAGRARSASRKRGRRKSRRPRRSCRCSGAGGRREARRSSAGATGKLEARAATAPPEREPSVFEQEGDDRFRTVSGGERGEALRVVRDDQGAVVKLYWATYPFTREPEIFGH